MPQPDVAHVFAVGLHAVRHGHIGKLADRRQPVHAADDARLVHAPGGHVARPAHQAERADAAFVHAALASPQRARIADARIGGVADAVVFGAVVAGEEHDRVVGQFQFVKRLQQPADLRVEVGQRRAEDLHLALQVLRLAEVLLHPAAERRIVGPRGERLVDLQLLRGRIERRVRQQRPHVGVERPVLVGLDEPDRLVDDRRAGLGPERRGRLGPRRVSAHHGPHVVDAVRVGSRRTVAAAQVPLAEVARGVTGVAEQLGNGGRLRIEPVGHGARLIERVIGKMAMDLRAAPG